MEVQTSAGTCWWVEKKCSVRSQTQVCQTNILFFSYQIISQFLTVQNNRQTKLFLLVAQLLFSVSADQLSIILFLWIGITRGKCMSYIPRKLLYFYFMSCATNIKMAHSVSSHRKQSSLWTKKVILLFTFWKIN